MLNYAPQPFGWGVFLWKKRMNTAKKLSIRLEAVGGDKVRQEFKNIGSDGQKAFQRITQVITPANDNLKVLDNTAKAFNNTLKQAASLAGAYLGLRGLTSAFKGIVQTNKEFESLIGSLKTVTGSAKGAQEAFSMIEKFALDTPYQLEEIIEAFTRLKALGLDATSEALTSYGNTASAFGKNILDFTSAVSSAVMLNFKSLRTFGIQTQVEGDKVRFTFQGITTTVGKSAQEIEAYLKSIGLVNFGGAMKEQMDTMGGAMSNIEDAISKLIRSIGENGLNKALKDTFSQFNELLDRSDGAAKAIGQTLATAVNVASKAFFISLMENEAPLLGVVFVPEKHMLFYAQKTKGAKILDCQKHSESSLVIKKKSNLIELLGASDNSTKIREILLNTVLDKNYIRFRHTGSIVVASLKLIMGARGIIYGGKDSFA